MKQTTPKSAKKLQLNKVTIVKLDANKLSKIWGGVENPVDQASTRPACDVTSEFTKTM